MIPPIIIRILGKDNVSSKLSSVTANMGKFGKKMQGVGKKMSMAVTLPMTMLTTHTLKTAGDFEYGMNRVKVLTGANGAEFLKLSDKAKVLGESTIFTAGQVTDGMQMLAQAGFSVDQIYSSIGTVLAGASANMVDMAESANIGAGLMKTFGYEAKEMSTVMDMLTKTSMSSMTNFTELSEAFVYAGPSAGAMGKTLKETSVVLGALANGMMKGSMAGTSLRGMMAKLTAPSAEAVKIMSELGIKYSDILDQKGNMKSFIDVIKAFENTGVTAGEVLQIFGLRAGPGFQILLNQGSKSLKEMSKKIGDFGGVTEKVAKVQVQGFKGQMWMLTSAFEGMEIAIAESGILIFFTKVGRKLTDLFRNLARHHKAFLKWMFIIGLVVGVLGPLLVAMGALLAMLPLVASGFGMLSTAMMFLWANPIGLIILAIAGALALLYIYWKELGDSMELGLIAILTKWEEFKTLLSETWQWIQDVGSALLNLDFGTLGKLFKITTEGSMNKSDVPDVAWAGGGLPDVTQPEPKQQKIKFTFDNLPKNTLITSETDDVSIISRGATTELSLQ